MATKRCFRCKRVQPITPNFIGVRGREVQICASCRGIRLPSPSPTGTTASPRTRSASPAPTQARARSRSPTPRGPQALPFASTASVAALEQRFEDRLTRLEDRLNGQFGELLASIRASQSTALAPQAPAPPPLPAFDTRTGPPQPATGESQLLSVSRSFAWVPVEVVALVERDQLKPEHLVRLRNPESRVSREASRSTGLTLTDGQLAVVEDSTDSRTSAFVKAIPSIAALAQVWLVYVAIRASHTANLDLNAALLAHLEQLIEFDHLYSWRAVADYHLAVCRQRFGTAAVGEWATYDPQIAGRVLFPYLKASQPAARLDSGASSSRLPQSGRSSRPRPRLAVGPASDTGEPCRRFNAGHPCSGCNRPHTCIHCKGAHALPNCTAFASKSFANSAVWGTSNATAQVRGTFNACTKVRGTFNAIAKVCDTSNVAEPARLAGRQAVCARTAHPWAAHVVFGTRNAAAMGRTALKRASEVSDTLNVHHTQVRHTSNVRARVAFKHAQLHPARGHCTPPPPRPNTSCKLPIFDPTDSPATVGSLQPRLWSRFLDLYPDQAFASQLRGALQHGVKLGYEGPLRTAGRLHTANLPMDESGVAHLRREIDARLHEGRLRRVHDPAAVHLVCSPVGVVPKPHSDKLRTIYHLSHPRHPGTRLPSVNDGIDTAFVAIHYESLDAVLDFVRENPGALLWKADLEDAFRHVIVAETDARLMGISFDDAYYQECALAFGARSSPFLFNLFAEFLHWLASFALQAVTARTSAHSDVSHYLDDFFGASAGTADPSIPITVLSLTAAALGFKLSAKKTVWAATTLEILGIEIDSVAQTASITQHRRHRIQQLCSRILNRGRASLLELQQVAGHLQFVTRVAPHGRAFLRRIYDAVKAHYKAPFGRRISKATRAELQWWCDTLSSWDGTSLLQPSPLLVEHIWTDASKRCIGAHWGSMSHPSAAFSRELSRRHRQKDIRFLEALAVLEALRQFSPQWQGHRRVVLHVDNENVEYGLRKGSIRDPQTQTLFREIFVLCLQRHIDLVPVRVSSADNVLADALSRRRFAFVQLHYPQAYSLLHFNRPQLLPPSSPPPGSQPAPPPCSGTALHQLQELASTSVLIEWVAHHHAAGQSYITVKRDLSVLKSWHVDLGLPTSAFNSPRLERVVRGFKRVVGNPLPAAKLPITLPLLRQLVHALPSVCAGRHDRRMFRAAFCLAFACFLRAGELTWDTFGASVLTVSSVGFAPDGSYATIRLPSSKTDPFRQGTTLTAPAVPLSTCAVACLKVICRHRGPDEPLFVLDGGRPFDRSSFGSTLRRCLAACGVSPSAYSGHSFRRGAATWAAANGADADTIRALGRWRSDCFRRYVDKSAVDRAATSRQALYANTTTSLPVNTPAWRDF